MKRQTSMATSLCMAHGMNKKTQALGIPGAFYMGVNLLIEVMCAFMAAAATVLCAVIAANGSKAEKERAERDLRTEERAKQRAREGRLQLAMIAANSELTIGVAMALKKGYANGEVEKGLEAVREANKEYTRFLEGVAIDHMNGGNVQ